MGELRNRTVGLWIVGLFEGASDVMIKDGRGRYASVIIANIGILATSALVTASPYVMPGAFYSVKARVVVRSWPTFFECDLCSPERYHVPFVVRPNAPGQGEQPKRHFYSHP